MAFCDNSGHVLMTICEVAKEGCVPFYPGKGVADAI